MTVKEIFEEKIPEGLKEREEKASKINSVYQFCITGDGGGDWVVDLTKLEVREGKEEAQCTITVGDQDFVDIVTTMPSGLLILFFHRASQIMSADMLKKRGGAHGRMRDYKGFVIF